MGRSGPGGMQGTLSKVINSLDKLVDLEKRIARLETDADGNHTTLKFKKGRQEGVLNEQINQKHLIPLLKQALVAIHANYKNDIHTGRVIEIDAAICNEWIGLHQQMMKCLIVNGIPTIYSSKNPAAKKTYVTCSPWPH